MVENETESKISETQPSGDVTAEASSPTAQGVSSGKDKVLEESEVKQAFIKRFKKKKKADPKTKTEPTPVRNNKDLAEKLYRDIAKTKGKEFLVIRLKKRSLLFVGAVFIIIMWKQVL